MAENTMTQSTPASNPARRAVPRVLTIAGTDPTGGAGIQADIKAITEAGGFALSVVTAVVSQNTRGVREVHGIDEHPMCRSRCYGQRQDQMRKTHKSSRHLLVVRYTFGRVNTREARVAFRSLSCEARVAMEERAAILVAGIAEADSKGCQYKQILLHVPG